MNDRTSKTIEKATIDQVVQTLKHAISQPEMRQLSNRAIQARIWHEHPIISQYMAELRAEEQKLQTLIMDKISTFIHELQEYTLDLSDRVSGDTGSLSTSARESINPFEVTCLDAKERLYLILKQYQWIQTFFHSHPIHFYENSFQFVDRIPTKHLSASVKIVGLGVGGALAASGLAKRGINVVGYEKRDREGPRRATIRYQNTSWRGYDVAERLLDGEAFERLMKFRQSLTVTEGDGRRRVITSDRTQVILGEAIETSYASADRYGATLRFGADTSEYYKEDGLGDGDGDDRCCDIVALFAGAHTADIFPLMKKSLNIMEYPEIDSSCITWLRLKESSNDFDYCARGGEVGAEHWDFEIISSRDDMNDLRRVKDSLDGWFRYATRSLSPEDEDKRRQIEETYDSQMAQVDKIISKMTNGAIKRYDYIFVNAPINPHNRAKRDAVGTDGTVVLDGGYTVQAKITESTTTETSADDEATATLLKNFGAKLIVTGGDSCVAPNPQAAYGATLACIFADMLVNLAVVHGHLNVILDKFRWLRSEAGINETRMKEEWIDRVTELKRLFNEYYDTRGRCENYFQFVQTCISNIYSLPPFENLSEET